MELRDRRVATEPTPASFVISDMAEEIEQMPDRRSPDYDEKRDEAATPPRMNPTGRVTPVLEPNEARAGTTKPKMWRVLIISLIGIVVLFAIVYFAFFPTPDGTQTALPPAETTLPDPAPPPAPAQ